MDSKGQNEEADALTNGDFAAFNQDLRVDVDVEKLNFKILPHMVRVAEDLYAKVKAEKEASKGLAREKRAKTRPEERLKVRDPW
jgi:hypothetical protein